MNPGRGIALKIVSTFVFTLMSVCVKLVADSVPAGEIVFARSFFALIPVAGMLLWQGQLLAVAEDRQAVAACEPRRDRHLQHGVRLHGARLLPLPEAMMIGYAAPLMVVALSAIILSRGRCASIAGRRPAIGFVGIIIILWPRLTFFERRGRWRRRALARRGLRAAAARSPPPSPRSSSAP